MKWILAGVVFLMLVSVAAADTNATLIITGTVVSHGGHGGGGSGGWGSLKPIASFVGSPTSGIGDVTVHFTDKSYGNPTIWKWEYRGDANWVNFSTEKNPKFTFSEGDYDIRLTVTNAYGSDTATRKNYISAHIKCRGKDDYEWLRWTYDRYPWMYGRR